MKGSPMKNKGLAVAVLLALLLSGRLPAQAPARERVPVLLDTDIGTDIDDAFALGFILASPELDLRGITTVGDPTQTRALMLCRFLTMTGRRHTPVAAGAAPQPKREIREQYQYYYHPDVLFNRTRRPEKVTAVEFLHARLRGQQGKITLLCTGPLTNVARLIEQKPDCKPWIKRIVWTGGSLNRGLEGKSSASFNVNVAADPKAARAVLASGIPLVVVPRDVTAGLKLDREGVRRVFAPVTALSMQVQALYQLWDREEPDLADVFTAALAFEERFCTFENACLTVDDSGLTRDGKGKANARVAVSVKKNAFLKWTTDRMASCLPPGKVPSKPVAQGGFPHRVHVAEDYDTDIERRWWMSGKAETKNTPPGSKRACRGVLTHDFDDLLGNPKAMYTAVVFNPVPGPPMGQNTRLSFRYWLKGTDSLRVQIYSLTNGYHRHLVLTGLSQGQWQEAIVDMTQARRPDGTGGPLSEGERIDDIQFYTQPTAELIIDDIFLYDAAPKGEKRPFPRRVHFSGLFDTGRQGKEWPGDFEIVPDRGYFWKAARSVENPDRKIPWIRLYLRGARPLGGATRLSFRYQLAGADSIQVMLANRATGKKHVVELKGLKKETWTQTTASFPTRQGEQTDEVHFLLPKGAELLLDDVVLYEPGDG
jgi:inosine-uridine nucleoside N-ribohydrolase